MEENKSINEPIYLKLGDIIEITSPSNLDFHLQVFYIEYIDQYVIDLIQVNNEKKYSLNIKGGTLSDESIEIISILSRSPNEGFARQNGLLENVWIEIYIGGNIPTSITGEITKLEEDMIEVTTYPEKYVIYIDFEYKGIPKNIPFRSFNIRNKPVFDSEPSEMETKEGDIDSPSMTINEVGEYSINIPENSQPDEKMTDTLRSKYKDADEIVFGEILDDVYQEEELNVHEKRYSIEVQTNDLLDELLSVIPYAKRTESVLKKIHISIERFKQLRREFSVFDQYDNISTNIYNGPTHKPLLNKLISLETDIKWILPIVSNKSKIHRDDGKIEVEGEIPSENIMDTLNAMKAAFDVYNNSGTTERYETLYRTIFRILYPYDNNNENMIVSKNVNSDIHAISTVNNNTLEADVFGKGEKSKKKMLIQKYNLSQKHVTGRMSASGEKIYLYKNILDNDNMNINSLLVTPDTHLLRSKMFLPGVDLLTKSTIHLQFLPYYILFNDKVLTNDYIIDNLETQEDEKIMSFMQGINTYKLDEKIESDDLYKKFLNMIIPDSRKIINHMIPEYEYKLNYHDVLKTLESFYIYQSDISYPQYNEIRYQIKELIKRFNIRYVEQSKAFNSYKNFVYQYKNLFYNDFVNFFFNKKELHDILLDGYGFTHENIPSNHEFLSACLNQDNMKLFSSILSILNFKQLNTPEDILNSIELPKIDDQSNIKPIKPADCGRKFLAKTYESYNTLDKDQNEEIFFDEVYDDSPYELLDQYSEQKKTMKNEDFKVFLRQMLVEKHFIPHNEVDTLVETLMTKKKKIEDGHYAQLIIRPKLPPNINKDLLTPEEKKQLKIEEETRVKVGYYKRMKNQWIKDPSIDETAFLDNSTIFCNINDCMKNEKTKICEPENFSTQRMNSITKQKMLNEFENRVTLSFEALENQIKEHMALFHRNNKSRQFLKQNEKYLHNRLQNELGKLAIDESILLSPYLSLKNAILRMTDFSKKQSNILKFIEMFCREPLQDLEIQEDQYFYYCKETNTKLLPIFYGLLANAFMNNHYNQTLEELCSKMGKLSDDGESIVDVHSGEVLKNNDFVNEETYNTEGFKVVSHDIIEEDLETRIGKILSPNQSVYENPQNQMIHNILQTLCGSMGIHNVMKNEMDTLEHFVMKYTNQLAGSLIVSKDKYEKMVKKKEDQPNSKKQIPYKIYKDRLLFWIISAHLLVGIQTSLEPVKAKKTYPGCVKSFDGYPLFGNDLGGIEYIACVLYGHKSNIEPWNSIKVLKKENYVDKIKDILESKIMTNPEIVALYENKHKYLELHPQESIPDVHHVNKWTSFMPPVVPFELKGLRTVSKDFEKELLEALKTGKHTQHELYNVFVSRMKKFGYGIIEIINHIVQSEDPLLMTSSKIPFLENACCHDESQKSLDYFINKNENLKQYISIISSMDEFKQTIDNYSRAPFLYHKEFTGSNYPTINQSMSDDNLYLAFIVYFNMNNDLPINENLRHILPEKLPNFPKNKDVSEQIEYLKREKRFRRADFDAVMNVIRNQNHRAIDSTHKYNMKEALFDILEKFNIMDNNVIDSRLQTLLRELIDTYDPSVMVNETRPELIRMKNYLAAANERLFGQIAVFMSKYGNLDVNVFNNFQDYLLNLFKGELHCKFNFIKNSIYNMTKLYPNMILNKKQHYSNVPKHWNLSSLHEMDLMKFINDYWKPKNSFATNDILNLLIEDVQLRLNDLFLFMSHLPFFCNIEKEGNTFYSFMDEESVKFLYTYLFYSVFYEYINLTEVGNYVIEDQEQHKSAIRDENRASIDVSQSFGTVDDGNQEGLLQEVDILLGNKETLKENVAKLLLFFINMESQESVITMTYDEIMKKVYKQKMIEKKKVTDYLGKFEDRYERKLEDQFKKYKMGKWNVGLQKALVQYNKDFYDKERMDFAIEEAPIYLEETQHPEPVLEERFGEVEGNDISTFTEEYYDGVEYEQDFETF